MKIPCPHALATSFVPFAALAALAAPVASAAPAGDARCVVVAGSGGQLLADAAQDRAWLARNRALHDRLVADLRRAGVVVVPLFDDRHAPSPGGASPLAAMLAHDCRAVVEVRLEGIAPREAAFRYEVDYARFEAHDVASGASTGAPAHRSLDRAAGWHVTERGGDPAGELASFDPRAVADDIAAGLVAHTDLRPGAGRVKD